MPNYIQQLDNIAIANLPGRYGVIDIDPPEEEAIVNISDEHGAPIVQYWFDPAAAWFTNEAGYLTWTERMTGEKFHVSGAPTLGPGINAQPALLLDGTGRVFSASGNARFNATEFTTVMVCRTAVVPGVKMLVGRASSPPEPTPVCPMLMLQEASSGGRDILASRENGGAGVIRAAHNSASFDYANANLLVMNTFSTRAGVGLRRNGAEVARNVAAVAPLTTTTFALGGDLSSSSFSGSFQHIFICRVDLSLPQWAFALERIESFLLGKYAIAMGS